MLYHFEVTFSFQSLSFCFYLATVVDTFVASSSNCYSQLRIPILYTTAVSLSDWVQALQRCVTLAYILGQRVAVSARTPHSAGLLLWSHLLLFSALPVSHWWCITNQTYVVSQLVMPCTLPAMRDLAKVPATWNPPTRGLSSTAEPSSLRHMGGLKLHN